MPEQHCIALDPSYHVIQEASTNREMQVMNAHIVHHETFLYINNLSSFETAVLGGDRLYYFHLLVQQAIQPQ